MQTATSIVGGALLAVWMYFIEVPDTVIGLFISDAPVEESADDER